MPINNSIIFYLDNILKLYSVHVVKLKNDDGQDLNLADLTSVGELLEEDGLLNLADRFEILWEQVEPIIGEQNVFFLIGERARFTDSRIIFTWLKSKKLFYPEFEFFITKINQDFSQIDNSQLYNILEEAQTNKANDLLYSKEPNIG